MKQLRLVEPTILYKESFLEFVKDVKETGYESYEHYIEAESSFDNSPLG